MCSGGGLAPRISADAATDDQWFTSGRNHGPLRTFRQAVRRCGPPPGEATVLRMKWWQRAVVYEIAPVSFHDSNADGRGDLPGLISQIDHLQWLGVNVVWLTPVFPSPFLDLGYDISDYCDIDPQYGTLHDFDRLVNELHRRGMRVLLDLSRTTPPTSTPGLWKAAPRD